MGDALNEDTMDEDTLNEDAMDEEEEDSMNMDDADLDCYPYTFTPLLLFCESSYFDRGYSNYNSVAQFFSAALGDSVNMLENVLYDRKNMLYEELLDYVIDNSMLVTCCIEAHFTAFQVLKSPPPQPKSGRRIGRGKPSQSWPSLLYYDPLKSSLSRVSGEGCKLLMLFLLMKCNYGDSQHIQDNKAYYTGNDSNKIRKWIYNLWRKINTVEKASQLHGVVWKNAPLNLEEYFLINNKTNPQVMSTQLTGNTCYFQTYLFALLCKIGTPSLSTDGYSVDVHNIEKLHEATATVARFLLTFFAQEQEHLPGEVTLRPLTNSNFVLDFFRYRSAPYYATMVNYMEHLKRQQQHEFVVPDYKMQYQKVMQYYQETKYLHKYNKFTLSGAMSSTPNTKSLQPVRSATGAARKLAGSDYYKYRAANLMFGFNSNIMHHLDSFCEFNALRKNQLLRFYEQLLPAVGGCAQALQDKGVTKYRDYYFMPQFEVGQQELVDVHHYTYLIDLCTMARLDSALVARVHAANQILVNNIFFSTQKLSNYDKFLDVEEFKNSKKYYRFFLDSFMSIDFLSEYVGLGFDDINPKEKEINSLTQTVFYSCELMRMQAHRQEYEFQKECINQMARSTIRKYLNRVEDGQDLTQKYRASVKIGYGYSYSKYNTLMHFLNVAESYWNNPDLSNIQVFGKDIRALLAISCQKIFFEEDHSGFFHYGPFENQSSMYSYGRNELDLAVAASVGDIVPGVSRQKRGNVNHLVITDRVYEFNYLKRLLEGVFDRANGVRFKSDNEVLNLCLLSLMLDFGLYEKHFALLNLTFLKDLQHKADTLELQVEVANLIFESDRMNHTDSVSRWKVEELIFEASCKFLINKNFPIHSKQFQLIRMLNADPDYQSYVLLCKIYMSLCQINKSVEVDYYKVRCDSEFRIIIPRNFSKTTSEYLGEITKHYTFSECNGIMIYDELPVFDLRPHQPEINLHKVRFDSATNVQSMVKYIEIANVFRVLDETQEQYLVFIADNVLLVEVSDSNDLSIRINHIAVEMATIFFNEAISFVPCFKYSDSEDIILFASENIHYLVDQGGQFCTDYYGMRHELVECIKSQEVFVDINDEHVFKDFKLSELLTESKTVVYFPDYLLQVPNRQQLINLLDLAVQIRNISFFILVLFYLRRGSIELEFIEKEGDVKKISGPWKEAILYVLNRAPVNAHYDTIFERQFFDLNQHEHLPLTEFIDVLCSNFTKYQRFTEDGQYQIVPTEKQKAFLSRIICAEECFHFSEVGSGKTKVILPLLCQIFLSNNAEAHKHLSRGGKIKDVLVVLVPEHLVQDARTQVYRYCLNLNFREEYRVYDDIFALMHRNVRLDGLAKKRFATSTLEPMKQIFVTSFNQFKKALTYDAICAKVMPHREHILVVTDEVDDFLDRDKLVFNICSNKNNTFDRPTLDLFFEVSRATYHGRSCPDFPLDSTSNPNYWKVLYEKFAVIHREIQDTSRSINKSFGIFNEQTLRHCSNNIVHDIEGYKSLIARPYESVNRAMPGSYYSDVERTIYLTYVILTEDIAKYDELFQGERKFISFEYWSTNFEHQLDYDDLVYGHEKLSEIVNKHPETKDGLARFLYEIILRRMEIRDKSRSVSSVDVIFNFDCIGFTGTPFLDNYPTFSYIRQQRQDDIPNLIDRGFYAYTSDALSTEEFEDRFVRFQGKNSNVIVHYVPSEFIDDSMNEMATLETIFAREEQTRKGAGGLNAIVDLCGIFKRSSIHDVRDQIKSYFGPDRFHYVYHIDQADNSDRVLFVNSDNDVQFDEEFYKYMCTTYGADLREKIFFFVDNRNVIGKDIPFQLVYQRHFKEPLFMKSAVLAHDVDDFSKIWQAMGRSRTLNETTFSVYKSGIPSGTVQEGSDPHDIKSQPLTRLLYERNCDCKMAGNISSIYQTLIALLNLSQGSFYHCDNIVNTFLEKMEMTISSSVSRLEEKLVHYVLGSTVPARILLHILMDKFRRSSNKVVADVQLTEAKVEVLLRHVVKQKFEQRKPSGDTYDEIISFLSGEQQSLMEISYTKEQQKQKEKQQNKNQNKDAMGVFEKKNRLSLTVDTDNYFKYSLTPHGDLTKVLLNLPISVPIVTITYDSGGNKHTINLYPTVQFMYSHHIHAGYITQEVQSIVHGFNNPSNFYANFLAATGENLSQQPGSNEAVSFGDLAAPDLLGIKVYANNVRQNPQYTIAALHKGSYLIGMKDQFNIHDLHNHPMHERIQYITDEHGFILFDKTSSRSVDSFGPYFIEQYIILEILSKQEVAQNVLEYYCDHKEKLHHALEQYTERQGQGFICWRFLMNEATKAAVEVDGGDGCDMAIDSEGDNENPAKRSKA